MKRIAFVTLVAMALTALVPAYGQTLQPTRTASTTLQAASTTVRITSTTITSLAAGTNYVVDLTRPGAVYEFNTSSGTIDFRRVVVRTRTGNAPISTWMSNSFQGKTLSGWSTRAFIIGASADLRRVLSPIQPARPTHIISCPPGEGGCTCNTKTDCDILLWFLDCGLTVCNMDHSQCVCTFRSPLE